MNKHINTDWLIKGEPYAVQRAALNAARDKTHFAYFMEMGLGKTATCIAEFVRLTTEGKTKKLLVVCPNSLKKNWANEIERFITANIRVTMSPLGPSSDEHHAWIINYESVIATLGAKLDEYIDADTYVVLDESIQIKNPQAKRSKKLLIDIRDAGYVRLLSGAPIVNSPLDIYPQLRAVRAPVEEIGKNSFVFRNRFCVMGGYMGKKVIGVQPERQEDLEEIISSVSFRAKKKDWTDLPEKSYTTRSYEMTKDQKSMYSDMLEQFLVEFDDQTISVGQKINAAQKLQQISSGFILDEDRKAHEIMPRSKNPKLNLLKEVMEEVSGKMLIFAHHRAAIDMLIEEFGAAYIRGGMSDDEIEEQKRLFNEGSVRWKVGQQTSAKYGHTLLGTSELPCYTTFYFENTYALDPRIQSEDRNHRHGQKHPVLYIDAVGSLIEEEMINALQNKLDMAEALIRYHRAERDLD